VDRTQHHKTGLNVKFSKNSLPNKETLTEQGKELLTHIALWQKKEKKGIQKAIEIVCQHLTIETVKTQDLIGFCNDLTNAQADQIHNELVALLLPTVLTYAPLEGNATSRESIKDAIGGIWRGIDEQKQDDEYFLSQSDWLDLYDEAPKETPYFLLSLIKACPTPIKPFKPVKKAQLTLFGKIKEQEGKKLIAAQTQYTPLQTELSFPELQQRNDVVASWLLDLYQKVGGMVTPGRGAPYSLRLFVGGLLHTPIKHRDGEFHYFPLSTDEVISWLHPNVDYVKYQQWDSFRNGLKAINDLGWVSVPGVGSVKVLDASVIPEKPTDPIVQFIVRVPPSAAHGATINWQRLCEYGRKSASLYRAYLTACEFMHRSAVNGQPITQMIGKAILDQDGNPKRLNGKIERSKTEFENNSLVRYVKGLNKAQLAQAIGLDSTNRTNNKKALAQFEKLAKDGVIDLKKEGRGRGVQYYIFARNKWQDDAQAQVLE